MAESIFAEFEVDAEIDVPTTVPTPRFLPRPGTKSAIWEYFGLERESSSTMGVSFVTYAVVLCQPKVAIRLI